MKKKILSVIVASICMFSLVGCNDNSDVINKDSNTTQYNRFTDTGDMYCINGTSHVVVYDDVTDIVYMVTRFGNYGGGLSILYDSEGNPMCLDEYNSTK